MSVEFYIHFQHELYVRVSRWLAVPLKIRERISLVSQIFFQAEIQSQQVNRSTEKMSELSPKHPLSEDRKQQTGEPNLLSIFYINMHSGMVAVVVTTTLCVEQKLIFLTKLQHFKLSNQSKQSALGVSLYKMQLINFFQEMVETISG